MGRIKNFWKQFTAWATGLGVKLPETLDILTLTRWRLTILYFIVAFLVLLPFGLWSNVLISQSLYHQLGLVFNDQTVVDTVTADVLSEFNRLRLKVWIAGTIVLFMLSFLTATISLRPLRRAFESQRNFIANASHELRTPLAIMKTTSEVALMDRDLTQKETVKTIKDNLKEIKRMTGTLFVLLSLSSYNSIERLRFSPINLHDVISRSIQLIKPAADNKEIHLIFSSENPLIVRGNTIALEEMALNLLKNAVTYTPKGGLVNITVCYEENNKVLLIVKDTGIGIPKEDLPRIFEPFFRGSNSLKERREDPSTGLGLAIACEIANLHQAKLEVKSELGVGTAFFVRFSSRDRRKRGNLLKVREKITPLKPS